MYYQRIKSGLQLPTTHRTIVREASTTAIPDGGNGMGVEVGYTSIKIAIKKARENGLGAVAV
jgi:LDH2 family malate/lactate/ureidoglycolate dehydrogenase